MLLLYQIQIGSENETQKLKTSHLDISWIFNQKNIET